jgi:hypothetical protein
LSHVFSFVLIRRVLRPPQFLKAGFSATGAQGKDYSKKWWRVW